MTKDCIVTLQKNNIIIQNKIGTHNQQYNNTRYQIVT